MNSRGPLSSLGTMADVLTSSVACLPVEVRAELALRGKRESFFRDLFSRQCTQAFPHVLCKPEWDISGSAVERWRKSSTGIDKTKGIVDLAVLETGDLFSEHPVSLLEFKLWYTLDAVTESKYSPDARNHLSVPKSAITDREKILSVRDGKFEDDYLVTFLLTVHADRLRSMSSDNYKEELMRLGVAYPAAHASRTHLKEGFDSVRVRGIERAFEAISTSCGTTLHVHLGTGESRGVPVSLDCLVTELR